MNFGNEIYGATQLRKAMNLEGQKFAESFSSYNIAERYSVSHVKKLIDNSHRRPSSLITFSVLTKNT